EESVDLLFVVGEEASSDVARATRRLEPTSRWLVNGEPTESRLVSASKGSQRVIVTTHGAEAHSAYPHLGSSAIDAMTRLLGQLPGLELPTDELLGETTVNVGLIRGGVAANVVPSACEAEIMIRLVGDVEPVKARFEAWARGRADLAWGSHVPAMRFHLLDGFESDTVAYVSDIPFLAKWGTPLLFGPGSIHVAHTPDEHVDLEELRASVDAYVRIVRGLLAS
ncbi:MAG TPA: M20/M25/M40 family metallo-hydrolase, partial [Longimicrobiales bacterium]|nr:M20/M25/M40 family metallo-hydrolase [Longimicrobiales bacterium]